MGAKAPLSEVLAAGLVGEGGLDAGIYHCTTRCVVLGPSTVEAALWADGYPIQWHRRKFAFMDWRGFDEEVWWEVRDDLKAERQFKLSPSISYFRQGLRCRVADACGAIEYGAGWSGGTGAL